MNIVNNKPQETKTSKLRLLLNKWGSAVPILSTIRSWSWVKGWLSKHEDTLAIGKNK
jgi:hypothetical protein